MLHFLKICFLALVIKTVSLISIGFGQEVNEETIRMFRDEMVNNCKRRYAQYQDCSCKGEAFENYVSDEKISDPQELVLAHISHSRYIFGTCTNYSGARQDFIQNCEDYKKSFATDTSEDYCSCAANIHDALFKAQTTGGKTVQATRNPSKKNSIGSIREKALTTASAQCN